jgi:putative spermidine/putrescine transport system substrate-binding protein
VAIESMWSPTVSELRAGGFELSYAQPREGYRAWHGCLGLSSHLRGHALDVAYEFLNWWLAGWAGALMARQGYYFSLRSLVQPHLSAAEWAYWYLGEPAREDLMGPDGRVAVTAGAVRDGGAYWQRLSHVAVWNTTMPEHNYLVRRWAQFLAA